MRRIGRARHTHRAVKVSGVTVPLGETTSCGRTRSVSERDLPSPRACADHVARSNAGHLNALARERGEEAHTQIHASQHAHDGVHEVLDGHHALRLRRHRRGVHEEAAGRTHTSTVTGAALGSRRGKSGTHVPSVVLRMARPLRSRTVLGLTSTVQVPRVWKFTVLRADGAPLSEHTSTRVTLASGVRAPHGVNRRRVHRGVDACAASEGIVPRPQGRAQAGRTKRVVVQHGGDTGGRAKHDTGRQRAARRQGIC
jgi:hypothetical protein